MEKVRRRNVPMVTPPLEAAIYKAQTVLPCQRQLVEAMAVLSLPWSIWDRNQWGNLVRGEKAAMRLRVWQHMEAEMRMPVYQIARQCGVSHSSIFEALDKADAKVGS